MEPTESENTEIDEDLSRRDVIKRGIRALVIGTLTSAAVTKSVINQFTITGRDKNYAQQRAANQQNPNSQPETGNNLLVKNFAADIYNAAVATMDHFNYPEQISAIAFGAFAATAAGDYFIRKYFKPRAFIAGAASYATAATLDSASTAYDYSLGQDPRLKEYGLEAYFFETNTNLPPYPTLADIAKLEAIELPIWSGVSGLIPPLGLAYLGVVPYILYDNFSNRIAMQRCFDIGDRVKELINKGNNANQIVEYLIAFVNNKGKFPIDK